MPKNTLEICVDSFAEALIATDGGADRLEVCADLQLDGLTPDFGMVEKIAAVTKVPLMVMIRNREGDFCYSENDIATMLEQMARFKKLPVQGFVFGCLTKENEMDLPAVQRLIEAAKPFKITFHRAFDAIANKAATLELLIELGVNTILTSGRVGTAVEGIENLKNLVTQADDRIEIMAGGKVDPDNAKLLLENTGAHTLHASLSVAGKSYSTLEKVQQLKNCIADREE